MLLGNWQEETFLLRRRLKAELRTRIPAAFLQPSCPPTIILHTFSHLSAPPGSGLEGEGGEEHGGTGGTQN